jgi:hypothetical protein
LAAFSTRASVRRASGFVQMAISQVLEKIIVKIEAAALYRTLFGAAPQFLLG